MSRIDFTGDIPKAIGDIYYVDGLSGNDANDGTSPETAKATITAGIGLLAAGDKLKVGPGTYAETVTLNVNQTEMIFDLGAIIAPAAGNALTISSNYCRVTVPDGALRVNNTAGANTGVVVSGNWNYLAEIRVPCSSTGTLGFDITGDGNDLRYCRCSAPLTAAFKVQGDKDKLEACCTGGESGDSSIGFWVTNSCDKARIRWCSSQGHETAGFQFDAGCTNIVCFQCESGGGDGHFIDNATATHLDLNDRDSRDWHEHVYPASDGEGTAGDPITVNNTISDETGTESTQDYFGDSVRLIPVATITKDWFYRGVNVFATTAADDQRFRTYRVEYDVSATRNGGNNWDENETSLTFDDASDFATGDLIWVATPGYKPEGEIVEITNIAGAVVTIARQTENSGRLGLHWDHTTNDGGNEVAYLCWRDENQFHSSDFDHSAASARDFTTIRWQHARRMHANDGLIARMINSSDNGDSAADITVIWSD